uniref:N-acetyltransferase domain-containing protein n=1 Tax=Strongyloides venezuelensis TaxID=75913 RepID=A0A0K0EX12_STRVS
MKITYRKPSAEDLDNINYFITDIFAEVEPVSKSLRLCKECFGGWANSPEISIPKESLDSGLSLLVEDEGKIIGARLVSICRRGTNVDEDNVINFKGCDKCLDKEDEFNRFLKMFSKLRNSVWKLVPSDVNVLAHREMSGIKTEYQRKGIGRQLAEKDFSDDFLKTLGIDGVVSETSSVANQHLLKTLGFKPLNEEKYSDYNIHPVDGSTSLILNFKKI